jgi:signal peptidase I
MKIRMSMLNTRKPPVKTTVAREIAEWAITLGLAVGLALCVHTWVGQVITVDGPSMQPTLWKGDRMLVGRVEYYFTKPKRGDIVIVSFPDRTGDIVKRVIATAGEKVKVSGGSVYINGKKLDEPYILEPINQDFAETTVPSGTVFVMGDNRNNSHDSRAVGPIPLSKVLGRVYAVVWPTDKWAKLSGYTGKFAD